jgi:hypothetical protein
MNTVGKILVILNFLFAVVVGAFLVVDFATRTNWQNEYTNLKRQHDVVIADRKTHIEENTDHRNKLATKDLEVEEQKRKTSESQKEAAAMEMVYTSKIADLETKFDLADAKLRKAITDLDALKVAEADLKTIVKNREQSIITLQDTVKQFRTEALAKAGLATALQDRNEQLLREVQDQSQKLSVALAGPGTGSGTGITVKNPNDPNPPKTFVKGRIEKVEGVYVQISLGTDQGVNNNNTLEVFRTSPEPKYLGMVRIVDAKVNTSVGQLIVPAGTTVRPQLRAGDNAWSKLSN